MEESIPDVSKSKSEKTEEAPQNLATIKDLSLDALYNAILRIIYYKMQEKEIYQKSDIFELIRIDYQNQRARYGSKAFNSVVEKILKIPSGNCINIAGEKRHYTISINAKYKNTYLCLLIYHFFSGAEQPLTKTSLFVSELISENPEIFSNSDYIKNLNNNLENAHGPTILNINEYSKELSETDKLSLLLILHYDTQYKNIFLKDKNRKSSPSETKKEIKRLSRDVEIIQHNILDNKNELQATIASQQNQIDNLKLNLYQLTDKVQTLEKSLLDTTQIKDEKIEFWQALHKTVSEQFFQICHQLELITDNHAVLNSKFITLQKEKNELLKEINSLSETIEIQKLKIIEKAQIIETPITQKYNSTWSISKKHLKRKIEKLENLNFRLFTKLRHPIHAVLDLKKEKYNQIIEEVSKKNPTIDREIKTDLPDLAILFILHSKKDELTETEILEELKLTYFVIEASVFSERILALSNDDFIIKGLPSTNNKENAKSWRTGINAAKLKWNPLIKMKNYSETLETLSLTYKNLCSTNDITQLKQSIIYQPNSEKIRIYIENNPKVFLNEVFTNHNEQLDKIRKISAAEFSHYKTLKRKGYEPLFYQSDDDSKKNKTNTRISQGEYVLSDNLKLLENNNFQPKKTADIYYQIADSLSHEESYCLAILFLHKALHIWSCFNEKEPLKNQQIKSLLFHICNNIESYCKQTINVLENSNFSSNYYKLDFFGRSKVPHHKAAISELHQHVMTEILFQMFNLDQLDTYIQHILNEGESLLEKAGKKISRKADYMFKQEDLKNWLYSTDTVFPKKSSVFTLKN